MFICSQDWSLILSTNSENKLALKPIQNTMARTANGTELTIPMYEPTYWQAVFHRGRSGISDVSNVTRFVGSDWLMSMPWWRHYLANSWLVLLCMLLHLNPFLSIPFLPLCYLNFCTSLFLYNKDGISGFDYYSIPSILLYLVILMPLQLILF